MSANGQLVFTDVDKVTFKGVGNASNAVIDTTTGKIGVGVDSPDANLHVVGNCFVSTNFELGGTMTMGTVTVEAQHELSAITATGNITPHTIQFTNPTTAFTTTGNVEVGKELSVTGNVAVDTDTLFVDSVNNRVGIGTTSPHTGLELTDNLTFTNTRRELRFNNYYDGGWKYINDGYAGNFRFENTGDFIFYTSVENTSGSDAVHPGLVAKMTIKNTGNVGIGTTSPGAPLEVHGPDLTGEAAGTTSLISRHVSGLDGVLNIFGVAAGNGEETLGLQTQIDNRAWATDIAGGWSTGNASRYDLLLQPYKGRVGIGTTSPNENLEIYGDGIRIHDPDSSPKLDFVRGGTSRSPNTATFGLSNYADWRITANGPRLNFQNQYSGGNSGNLLDVMTLEHGTGNVGIGTTSPSQKLSIYTGSTTVAGLSIDRYSTGNYRTEFYQADTGLAIHVGNASDTPTEKMRIHHNGNVGIGTSSPKTKLDIVGDTRITGSLCQGHGTNNYAMSVKKYSAVSGSDIAFTFSMRLYCNWIPGIINIKAAMNNGNSSSGTAWNYSTSFRGMDCGSGGALSTITTIDGADPGTDYLSIALDGSTNILTITAKRNTRDNIIAECEVISYGGIYI